MIPTSGKNSVYLRVDHWNDFSYVTMFHASLHNHEGEYIHLGAIKIGFKGQTTGIYTHDTLIDPRNTLPENYFSLGTDLDYYQNLYEQLSPDELDQYLRAMNDIVFDRKNFTVAQDERVFNVSLLRSVSLSAINGQFKRVLAGGNPLTDFHFIYKRTDEEHFAGIELSFQIHANAKPSTNIHAIIGRNGVGKTSLLNGMINAITQPENQLEVFWQVGNLFPTRIRPDYFSSLVSVSFSAFDPFNPPIDQPHAALGTRYHYIGLKDTSDTTGLGLKKLPELQSEFVAAISHCWSEKGKKRRWLHMLSILESDSNFAEMGLSKLQELSEEPLKDTALFLIKKMSSGHAIVLLTLTKLVAAVEEKTLVIIDEPECHLHPPLLSAFTRALSNLLFNRNGVALIATHSPVVLQEIPKSCVWKIYRSHLAVSHERPEIETFGENVGVLTREIFGLEVSKSGFHTLLKADIDTGNSYEEIIESYSGQLGQEGKAILRSMLFQRDRKLPIE